MRDLYRFVVGFIREPRQKLALQSLLLAWFELFLFFPTLEQGLAKNDFEQFVVLLMVFIPLAVTSWLLWPKRKRHERLTKSESPD